MTDATGANTPDEQSQIDRDIEEAKKSLVSKETQAQIEAAKAQARKETEAEMLIKQKLEKLEEENKKLREAQVAKEAETAKVLDELRAKVNSAIGSRAPAKMEDPFQEPAQGKLAVDRLSDAQIADIEKRSAEVFFGTDYDHFIKSMRE